MKFSLKIFLKDSFLDKKQAVRSAKCMSSTLVATIYLLRHSFLLRIQITAQMTAATLGAVTSVTMSGPHRRLLYMHQCSQLYSKLQASFHYSFVICLLLQIFICNSFLYFLEKNYHLYYEILKDICNIQLKNII